MPRYLALQRSILPFIEPWRLRAQSASKLAMLRLLRGYSIAQQARLRRLGFYSRWIMTSVGRLRYLEYRSNQPGPTWIFLHGFASQATDWEPLLRRLKPHSGRMIAIDLPGHGASAIGVMELSPQHVLDGVYDAMEHLLGPNEHAILVGNSMGGLGVVRMAQAHPDKIDRVILLSPLGAPMHSAEREAVRQLFDLKSHGDALALVSRLFVKGVSGKHVFAVAMRALLGQSHLKSLLAGAATYDKMLEAGELTNFPPTLLVWGQADTILPQTGLTFFSRELAQARVVTPSDFGHAPFLDQADAVARVIEEWLAE